MLDFGLARQFVNSNQEVRPVSTLLSNMNSAVTGQVYNQIGKNVSTNPKEIQI